jgi:hypothetical protein
MSDYDAKWDDWFDQQRKNGMAVLARDEWKAKLDEAASIGYAEGRDDERKHAKPLHDEMLSALRFYASGCDATETTPCGYHGNMCCKTASAAIAKATGSEA